MAFYEMDPALEESLLERTNRVILILEIQDDAGEMITLPEEALQEGNFHSYKDFLGGYCVTGSVSFLDEEEFLSGLSGQDRQVRILFSSGNCGRFLHRFTLTVDDKGFRRSRTGGITRITATLEDAPARMKRVGGLKNWEEKQIIIDCVMSDKEHPQGSLVHLIAARGGLGSEELDCSTVELPLVYAHISASPWEELCSLATSCSALVEGGLDHKILFSSSVYQRDGFLEETSPLREDLFYEMTEEEAGDVYTNSVRLKWNRPERLNPQILWRYDELPVEFDDSFSPSYPFLPEGDRPIQDPLVPYEALFEVRENYKSLPVLWADQIQSQEEVLEGLQFEADGGGTDGLTLSSYTTESQRAYLNLSCSQAGRLINLSILGQPIVMRAGTACFRSDEAEIALRGLRILSGRSRFFSDALVTGADGEDRPHWEDWVLRALSQGIKRRRRYRGRSEVGLFYMRAGALCSLEDEGSSTLCRVEELEMNFQKSRGLETRVTLLEE
jgi:hypothetical protein